MIEFDVGNDGSLQIRQRGLPPVIYFDHWALRKFSEDRILGSRFATALERRNGTLAISWLNLAEFAKVTIGDQACSADSFIEANVPRLFFLECNPFVVIEREDKLLAGGEPIAPHADVEFLKAFAELKPDSVRPFTARGLFQMMRDTQPPRSSFKLADIIIDRVAALRDERDSNLAFQSTVRRRPDCSPDTRSTRVILRELVRPFLVNRAMKLTQSHAIDLLHAVVPVAYCDLVLLDKHWKAQVDQLRSRLNGVGIARPVAKVFSARRNGVEEFLSELESYLPPT